MSDGEALRMATLLALAVLATACSSAETTTTTQAVTTTTSEPPPERAVRSYDVDGVEDGEVISAGHVYGEAGVYELRLDLYFGAVEECSAASSEAIDTATYQYIVVYDPTGGFVTGGGWIDSPAGAYTAEPELTGKATFGFVSKYKKGATVPTGNTEFVFHVADLEFHSTSYDWLVIAGHSAKLKGTGTINGSGDYGFMLTAVDEALTPSTDVDEFRIKIWDKNSGDEVVYDNKMGASDDSEAGTALGGGSIVIHKAKSNAK